MEDTKKVLRSLLVSSPLVFTVKKLNNDYRDFMGFDIPYKELGFDSLLSLLQSMTDVLEVRGNSSDSEVALIPSEKTAHVNDLVMKQKLNTKGKMNIRPPNRRPRYPRSTGMNQHRNFRNTPTRRQSSEFDYSKINSNPINNDTDYNTNKYISMQSLNSSHKNQTTSNQMNANEVQPLVDDVKLSLVTNMDTKRNDLHYLRRPDCSKGNDANSECDYGLGLNNLTLGKDEDDFMRQLLFKKDLYKTTSRKNLLFYQENFYEKNDCIEKSQKNVPENIQENLKSLISKFPNGIWCSDLPTEYQKQFNKSLKYEDMGYRCLINLCMDLHDIFICSKESSCDYKLYDVTKPLVKSVIFEDVAVPSSTVENSPERALPKLDWKSCSGVIPSDILPLGGQIKREFIQESQKENFLKVVVAEIYDPSKFWLYKNDGQLDQLMDSMQEFYKEDNETYIIPEELLDVGLYCAVITLNEFHRAKIINVLDDIVKVFFIDYGSLGVAPKNKVWFLKKCFSDLSAQAIRARLADIYPTVENSAWSREAIRTFRGIASMKPLEANIRNIIPQKKIIEVYLENPVLCPGQYVNDILCSSRLALKTNIPRGVCIEDPHCIPKVKYVHLFPTFEEIEYWLVPSVEDIIYLSQMDISPDLFLPQYFSRNVEKSLLDRIEKRARKTCKRREKLTKNMDLKKLDSAVPMEEMDRALYGDAYSRFENDLKNVESDREVELEDDDTDSNEDIWNFVDELRRKRYNITDQSRDVDEKGSMNQNHIGSEKLTKSANDENEEIAKQFFGAAFVEEAKKLREAQVDNSNYWSKLNSRNLLDLEGYSTQSSRSNSPSPSKTEDFDSYSSSCEESHSDLIKCEGSTQSSSSMLNSVVELNKTTSDSDLIKLDVVLDHPFNAYQKTPKESDGLWSGKIEVPPSDPFGSLSEESFSSNNVTGLKNSRTKTSTITESSVYTTNTSVLKPNLASGLSPNVIYPKKDAKEPPMPPKSWMRPENTNPYPRNIVRPPPGFGPVPSYGAAFEVGTSGNLSAYQPWSTNSMGNSANFHNQHLHQQQLFGQINRVCAYPPVIINYNIMTFMPNFGGTPGEKKNTDK